MLKKDEKIIYYESEPSASNSNFVYQKLQLLINVIFSFLVRDALHKKFPYLSRNKTSRACQRRINYMLKNPTTFSNVNLFLAEIKQDPMVLTKFPIPERGEISRDENEKRMKRDFPPLLDILVKKFKRKFHSDGDLEKIPDDIDELKRRFWIKIPENHLQSKIWAKFAGINFY